MLFNNLLFAQSQNEFWSKINVTTKINSHWTLGIDGQHRRQADYLKHDKNIFQHTLTNSIRLWAFYKLKQNWTIVASPIAYFNNKNINNTTGNFIHSNELRSMIGISKNFRFGNFFNINRLLYEVDFIKAEATNIPTRQRYRLLNNFILPIRNLKRGHSINYNFYNEIFLKTQARVSSFDQNHFYNGIQWQARRSDLNIGYQYTYQKGINGYIHKNQLLFSLNFAM